MNSCRVLRFGLWFWCGTVACHGAQVSEGLEEALQPEVSVADYGDAIGPEPRPVSEYHVGEIRSGDALSTALGRLGVSGQETDAVVRALHGLFDFRVAKRGHWFEIERGALGELQRFRYTVGPRTVFSAHRDQDGSFLGLKEPVVVDTKATLVTGTVEHSLSQAMQAVAEKPWLALTMVDILAWDVDFFTETQTGDTFRILVEKHYVDGDFVDYGRILGAEYGMRDKTRHRAFFYQNAKGKSSYFREDGTAVERAFLKSPIKFASVTSRYGLRRHPVLKYVRAHRGVDYGAPQGTSVWTVADGVVRFVGRRGNYGKMVIIRHKNAFETRYAHLSRFARGLRRGVRVTQKQVVGYVGQTGLATGPHLHFEVLKRGRHINPKGVVSPPRPPVPEDEVARFRDSIRPVALSLDGPSVPDADSEKTKPQYGQLSVSPR